MPTVPSGCGPPASVNGETTVIDAAAVATAFVASSTCTVKLDVPCAVGVPEMTPVVGEIESPDGSVPATMLHAYGVTPPVATSDVV